MINLRDGYDAKTDALPKKMFHVAKEGVRAEKAISFKELMAGYYKLRGWNAQGELTPKALNRLAL